MVAAFPIERESFDCFAAVFAHGFGSGRGPKKKLRIACEQPGGGGLECFTGEAGSGVIQNAALSVPKLFFAWNPFREAGEPAFGRLVHTLMTMIL
jgi:hypothetical protein